MTPSSCSITVAIPALNATKALTLTLESVLAQTYQDWECLVAGDDLTDIARNIACAYEKKDNRVRYIGEHTQDDIYAACIKEAKFNLILFLEVGDCVSPQHLLKLQNVYPLSYYQLKFETSHDLPSMLYTVREEASNSMFPKQTRLQLARAFLQYQNKALPLTVSQFYALEIDAAQPIRDLFPPSQAERLFCAVKFEGEYLGTLELPICDGNVPERLLRDAIAAKFAWQILGKYLAQTTYRYIPSDKPQTTTSSDYDEQVHNELGWQEFLRQLWGKPEMTTAEFYNPSKSKDKGTHQLEYTALQCVEISGDLPTIVAAVPEVHITFTAGGIRAGVVSLPVTEGKVTAHALRAAITSAANFELCRICVREALIGSPLDARTTLREKLQSISNSYSEQNTGENETTATNSLPPDAAVVLCQRFDKIGTSASRYGYLPSEATPEVLQMVEAMQEPFEHIDLPGIGAKQIAYMPSAFKTVMSATPKPSHQTSSKKEASLVFGRSYFESLFIKNPDPWKYTHPYEQTKYEQTLSLLPDISFDRALEIACAEGHFTQMLAPRVKQLTATDISEIALKRAAARCGEQDNIQYKQFDLLKDPIPGTYDLMVCSEMLYFLVSVSVLETVASKMVASLSQEGYLLMAHAHQIIDDPKSAGYDWGFPFGAKVIGEVFAKVPGLQLIQEIRTPLYRIQLFQRKKPTFFGLFNRSNSAVITQLPQPTDLPPRVAGTVYWEGGKPSESTFDAPVTTTALPILMYHRVAPDGAQNMQRYRVTPERFEEQLRFLRDSGYYSVGAQEWIEAAIDKKPLLGRAVIITFDDGYSDFYEYAWPLLKRYGFSATVFTVTGMVGQVNKWDSEFGEEVQLMRWQQIRQLYREGVSFEAHTVTHQPLTDLSPLEITRELVGARTALKQQADINPSIIAYPYGATDEVVAHLAGVCGYTAGFGCAAGRATFQHSLLQLPRIEVKGSDDLQQFVFKLES
ncbi:polysaccharide deacetylase family protein [Pontibacter sp. CAU 1760]